MGDVDGLGARHSKTMAMVKIKIRPWDEWRWYEVRSSEADVGYLTSS